MRTQLKLKRGAPDGNTATGSTHKAAAMKSANTATQKRASIVLFGDSLTERSFEVGGFGARMQHEFRRCVDVKARGYSGYNTDHAVSMLDQVFTSEEPSPVLVTVLFGSNDACDGKSPAGAVQHVPVERYEKNLVRIAESVLRLKPSPRLLFITPPRVDDDAWAMDCSIRAAQPGSGFGTLLAGSTSAPNRTTALVKPYVEAMKRVAHSISIPVVDLYDSLQSSIGGNVDSTAFVDGLHFSEIGQRRVAELIINAVREHFPRLAAMASDSVKCDYPDWKYLDLRGDRTVHAIQITTYYDHADRIPVDDGY